MTSLLENAAHHLNILCNEIETRQVGSRGNQQATTYVADVFHSLGFEVDTPSFDCMDWIGEKAELFVAGQSFDIAPSPYSLPCNVRAPLHIAGSLADLQALDCKGEILLLRNELAREQIMPKNFPFYNPELHQMIVGMLENKAPAAIITATGRNPELAGAVYPFPLFEDGDFNIPSVFTTDEVGNQLLPFAGYEVSLFSRTQRIPSTGSNVTARLNQGARSKIVVCAHVDAKIDSPGALDNAAGVVTLLLVADLLQNYAGDCEIELLAMNGEDYYGANGERLYLEQNDGNLGRILSFINMDAVGFHRVRTAVSFYNQPETRLSILRNLLKGYYGVYEGEPWFQGDHMALAMYGVPAVALTSENFIEIEQNFVHTVKDIPDLVDVQILSETAEFVQRLISVLSASGSDQFI